MLSIGEVSEANSMRDKGRIMLRLIQKYNPMALENKVRLTLFDIKKIEFKDKESGEPVIKYKYSFFDKENVVHTGYLEKELFQDRVQNTPSFIADKSHDYVFHGRVWNEEITWRLIV